MKTWYERQQSRNRTGTYFALATGFLVGAVASALGTNPVSAIEGDYNKDGITDVAVASPVSTRIFLRQEDGELVSLETALREEFGLCTEGDSSTNEACHAEKSERRSEITGTAERAMSAAETATQ